VGPGKGANRGDTCQGLDKVGVKRALELDPADILVVKRKQTEKTD
jgi:hypothetical protein